MKILFAKSGSSLIFMIIHGYDSTQLYLELKSIDFVSSIIVKHNVSFTLHVNMSISKHLTNNYTKNNADMREDKKYLYDHPGSTPITTAQACQLFT